MLKYVSALETHGIWDPSKYFISLLLLCRFYMFFVYLHPAHFLGMQVFLHSCAGFCFLRGLVWDGFLVGFLFCLSFWLVGWVGGFFALGDGFAPPH